MVEDSGIKWQIYCSTKLILKTKKSLHRQNKSFKLINTISYKERKYLLNEMCIWFYAGLS